MATYRPIAPSETDANSPLTAQLMSALADNPTAIMEQAAGAPRYAQKVIAGSAVSSSDLTFFGFSAGGYTGAVIHGHWSSDSSSRSLTLQIGDATTLAAVDTLITTSTENSGSFTLAIDLTSGNWQISWIYGANAAATSGTATLPAGAVTRIRINTDTGQDLSATCIPNGGLV